MKSLAKILPMLAAALLTASWAAASVEDLSYYWPEQIGFVSELPSPEAFLGYPIGSFHTRHDRLVAYFERLAKSSRTALERVGQTPEHRELVLLAISSPRNIQRLEQIRQEHLTAISSSDAEHPERPVIIYLGYGVHGNEASSAEAAMLTAYYFAAGEGESMERLLDRAVILIDPVYNPDGRDRHTFWVDMHRAANLSADAADREHNEGWPNGRTNHYWFDLNRDWLPAVHIESRLRLENFHRWMPNVTTDFHEMGTNSTYFFEPTHPNNRNPLVPEATYEMTGRFAERWSKALDEVGSLYYTRERYDDFYPGYGNSYPDLHGGVGALFEQAGTRGHVQETDSGKMTFGFTIRNHVRTGIATVRTAVDLRSELFQLRRRFYDQVLASARESSLAGYVFGLRDDAGRNEAFLELLQRHRIEVRPLLRPLELGDDTFEPGSAWLVLLEQRQAAMVRSIFETQTEFPDVLFYDTSAWSMPHAYGVPAAEVVREGFSIADYGPPLTSLPRSHGGIVPGPGSYSYVFDWTDYRAPSLLWSLQDLGIRVRASFEPLHVRSADDQEREFARGAMVIPAAGQELSGQDLAAAIDAASAARGITVYAVPSGLSARGVDLGSPSIVPLEKPSVLLLIGDGVSASEAGEVWHLLDVRVGMPITKADLSDFPRLDLHRYTAIVMVSGNYGALGDRGRESLAAWTRAGGTLIVEGSAVAWAISNKLFDETPIARAAERQEKAAENPRERPRMNYADARETEGAKVIGGAIFEVDVDLTHPLAFGLTKRRQTVYRNREFLLAPSRNPYSTVVRYTDQPLINGYISETNLRNVAGTASLVVSPLGRGRGVLFVDDPNFRGFWYGTNRFFVNAVFLGSRVDVPRVRD